MIRSLWTASTGMAAQQLQLVVISNNLANVNTNGFKKSRVDFQDLIYQTLRPAGATEAQGVQSPTGEQVGLGTKAIAIQKVFSTGEFKQTGNPLDVAIEGSGFFQILMPSGQVGYTRDGSFKTDSQGRIVTSDGYLVQPEITVPADALETNVGVDGTVTVVVPGQSQPQQIGQIQLVKFQNPAGLSNQGRNLFSPTAASGEPVAGTPGQSGIGTLNSGILELSNVQVVEEMVNMIVAQRAYEINSKAIQGADEMLQIANNLRR